MALRVEDRFRQTAVFSVSARYHSVTFQGCLASQNVPCSLRSASLTSHAPLDQESCCWANQTVTNNTHGASENWCNRP
ncbi:hypothetical protein ACROYT_G032130 [Oculina patagonica]